MDNPGTEPTTGGLTVDQAAGEFASILSAEPVEKEEQQEAPQAQEAAEVEAQEPPAEEPAEQTVTVKINGQDVEVPLSELKNSYQKDKVSTERFMAAAEMRKQAEAESAKAQAERQQYAMGLQKAQAQLEGVLQEQQQINWQQLLEHDPQEYLKQQHLFQQRQAAYQQNLAQQQQLAAIQQAEAAKAKASFLSEQQEKLLAKLPDWKDPDKANSGKVALRDYLMKEGFDAEAIGNIADHRAVVLAHKAMMYDQMMSKAQAATKKVAALPTKVERPGVSENTSIDKRQAAYQRLAKTGRVEDAASLLSQYL